jgi:Reverse transcriptase (RNA-dependent DNA polymerase)
VYEHEAVAGVLARCFFVEAREDIPLHFPDDPPAHPSRRFHRISEEECWEQLRVTANTSAPGDSGIGWSLLKRAWGTIKELLTFIFNRCLCLGVHPTRWKHAVVVVIPKPDKPDYSHAKAHRPISLLEAMSKLLKKVIAKRMQHNIVAHELIPTSQFGGRMHSSCLDAGLTLIHDVQRAHQQGLKCSILLFDIKGFFDHVNHDRMVAILERHGYPQELTQWVASFLWN